MYRILLLVLNATAVAFLIFRLLKIYDKVPSSFKKNIVIISGITLLVLPVTMIFGFVPATPVYLVVYPIGIFLFVYMFRLQD